MLQSSSGPRSNPLNVHPQIGLSSKLARTTSSNRLTAPSIEVPELLLIVSCRVTILPRFYRD